MAKGDVLKAIVGGVVSLGIVGAVALRGEANKDVNIKDHVEIRREVSQSQKELTRDFTVSLNSLSKEVATSQKEMTKDFNKAMNALRREIKEDSKDMENKILAAIAQGK